MRIVYIVVSPSVKGVIAFEDEQQAEYYAEWIGDAYVQDISPFTKRDGAQMIADLEAER